ncbi:MAG: thiolase family protein [Spirochaetaceae bacterium]|jgi:acetyl-CoA acyltransferase|nr:thiolase family protein [Spirochaetaceae bacterium]
MSEAVLVAMGRSALGKASRGTLKQTRPEDIAAQVLAGVLKQAPQLSPKEIDDVILGCAFPEAEQGINIGRVVALEAGLDECVPGQTVNRFCSSGLQSIAIAANSIAAGQNDIVAAGGVESMSAIPIGGNQPRPNPSMMIDHPHVYDSMGITAENVAERYHISREDQDAFALASHQKALAAQNAGKFREEIIPIMADTVTADPSGKKTASKVRFDADEGIRADTSMEILAKLRPSFRVNGTVTAGNSSQMSDGAAFAVLMSAEKAKALGCRPIAKLAGFSVAGVAPEVMGIGPLYVIPKVLKRCGYTLNDIDLFELNEAFAAQALACMRNLGLDPARVNVNGGAIAMGHPLGCSGAALTVKLLSELRRTGKKRGVVSMCIGGGMGAAAVFEMIG